MGLENPFHLLFIAVVALVVLGPRRLPELARSLGKGMREFRDALNGERGEHELRQESTQNLSPMDPPPMDPPPTDPPPTEPLARSEPGSPPG
jgi:sec-independent protein translocase protein TatA